MQHPTQLPSTSQSINDGDMLSSNQSVSNTNCCYAIVRNIPQSFHSKHLRRYFSSFVETGRFDCFHFRHRPEIQTNQQQQATTIDNDDTNKKSNANVVNKRRLCCIVKFSSVDNRQQFIEQYNTKHWTNENGTEIPLRCFIFRLKVTDNAQSHIQTTTDTISSDDISAMIELHPPDVMPQGNVGTPSRYFFEQIRRCTLPSSIIAKLGLKPITTPNRFGAVSMQYASSSSRMTNKSIEETVINAQRYDDDDGDDDDDRDECQEWERHEAIHDDVTEQDRTKPKLFEDEEEVTWEKGGAGLVWYTDAFYWDQTEQGTDCDWRWTDDWDVDYSIYYDRTAGDIDARQAVEMREDTMLRGCERNNSVFNQQIPARLQKRKRRRSADDTSIGDNVCGGFEKYTKGIGGRYLKRFGWQPGKGIGSREGAGRPYPIAIEIDTDNPSVRGEYRGFGYHGEKLQRTGFTQITPKRLIGTKYDRPVGDQSESSTTLLRSHSPTQMKNY